MGAPLTPNSTCRTPNRRRSSSWRTASAPSGPSNCRRTPTGSSTAASPRCCSTTGGSATPRAPPAGRPVPPPGRPARSRRRRPDRTVGHVVRRRPRRRDGGETRRRRRPLAGPLRRRNRDADPPGARLGTRLSAHGDEHGLRDAVRGLLRLDPTPSRSSGRRRRSRCSTRLAPRPNTGTAPAESDWETFRPARVALRVPLYRPISRAGEVDAPPFLTVARGDRIVPPSAAERLDHVELLRLDCDHVDVYHGAPFERAVAEQAAFLARHLR